MYPEHHEDEKFRSALRNLRDAAPMLLLVNLQDEAMPLMPRQKPIHYIGEVRTNLRDGSAVTLFYGAPTNSG
jgi:hypothetical protein